MPPNPFASFSASLNPFSIQSSSSAQAFFFSFASSSSSSIFDAALGFGSNLFTASASSPALSGGSSFNSFAAAAHELKSARGSLLPSAAAADGTRVRGGHERLQSTKWHTFTRQQCVPVTYFRYKFRQREQQYH